MALKWPLTVPCTSTLDSTRTALCAMPCSQGRGAVRSVMGVCLFPRDSCLRLSSWQQQAATRFVLLCCLSSQNTWWWCNQVHCVCSGPWPFNLFFLSSFLFDWLKVLRPWLSEVLKLARWACHIHSSGAVWETRWPSWAVRHNEPSGFRGCKDLLNHALALVSACP